MGGTGLEPVPPSLTTVHHRCARMTRTGSTSGFLALPGYSRLTTDHHRSQARNRARVDTVWTQHPDESGCGRRRRLRTGQIDALRSCSSEQLQRVHKQRKETAQR